MTQKQTQLRMFISLSAGGATIIFFPVGGDVNLSMSAGGRGRHT